MFDIILDNNMADLSLVTAWAYHCSRCNYVWFPKGYDYRFDKIEDMKTPKRCRNCGSEYWNNPFHMIRRDKPLIRRLKVVGQARDKNAFEQCELCYKWIKVPKQYFEACGKSFWSVLSFAPDDSNTWVCSKCWAFINVGVYGPYVKGFWITQMANKERTMRMLP